VTRICGLQLYCTSYRYRTVLGFCSHDYENSSSIKSENISEYLSNAAFEKSCSRKCAVHNDGSFILAAHCSCSTSLSEGFLHRCV
jgi:hypothetical protein